MILLFYFTAERPLKIIKILPCSFAFGLESMHYHVPLSLVLGPELLRGICFALFDPVLWGLSALSTGPVSIYLSADTATVRFHAKSSIMTSFLVGGEASFFSKTVRVMGPFWLFVMRGICVALVPRCGV
jgi:hypothetical protein